jgi:Leucine-rich repeat (LRR) protein
VDFSGNKLCFIDLTMLKNINTINLNDNELKHVDVKNLDNLVELYLGGNKLESIDLTGLDKLKVLYMVNNNLQEEPDVSMCENLEDTDFAGNPFSIVQYNFDDEEDIVDTSSGETLKRKEIGGEEFGEGPCLKKRT